MLLNREKSHHFNNSNTGSWELAVISLSPSEFSNTTCLSCDAASVNRTFDYTNRSVIERSIVFDWQNFIVNSIMFDWVQQSNDSCSIGFDCRTVRLDRSGSQMTPSCKRPMDRSCDKTNWTQTPLSTPGQHRCTVTTALVRSPYMGLLPCTLKNDCFCLSYNAKKKSQQLVFGGYGKKWQGWR